MFSFVLNTGSRVGPSTFSSKTRWNLFSGQISCTTCFFWLHPSGGGNNGSATILIAFSSMLGIRRASKGLDSSKHGLVLTSIRNTLKSSSIMKSSPKTYKDDALETYFKSVDPLVGVHLAPNCFHTVRGQLFKLRKNVSFKENALFCVILVQVVLKVSVGELVSSFVLTVVFCLLLDGVVCQMDQFVGQVVDCELPGWRSEITLVVEIAFHISVNTRNCCIGADVKLSLVYKQGVADVLLNDAGPLLWFSGVVDESSDLVVVLADWDALASVGILTGFNDPNISFCSCISIVVWFKSKKFWILKATFDMESHRKRIERVLADCFVVETHVQKQGFLVWQMVVVFNFVVDFYWILLQFDWSWFWVFRNRLRKLLNHGALFDGRGHLIRRCSSLAFWRWRGLDVLLIYFLRVDQFCLDWAHDFILPALGPHKIDLIHFLLIVQQPPKPCLKQWPYEHTIVSFADVHFEMLDQLLFVSSQGLQSQHRVLLNLNCWLGVLVKFFVKNARNFWVEAVGFADDSAPTGDKFFLQQVRILSAFEIGGL